MVHGSRKRSRGHHKYLVSGAAVSCTLKTTRLGIGTLKRVRDDGVPKLTSDFASISTGFRHIRTLDAANHRFNVPFLHTRIYITRASNTRLGPRRSPFYSPRVESCAAVYLIEPTPSVQKLGAAEAVKLTSAATDHGSARRHSLTITSR